MVKLLKDQAGFQDRINQFGASDIHVVCLANTGSDSFASQFLSSIKVEQSSIDAFCNKVNSSNETGCLFPKHYMSLIPKSISKMSELICLHLLKDVLVANEQYFKSETILFAIDEDSGFDCDKVIEFFEKVLEEDVATIKFLSNVFVTNTKVATIESSATTLVIHPQDQTTDFLKPIYSNITNKKLITGGISYEALKSKIEMVDEVIICGHGYHGGLFAINQFEGLGKMNYIVDNQMASLLKLKKKVVTIWCYAKHYIESNDINNSFHSGMFISEVNESIFCGLEGVTQEMIDESNNCFSVELGTLIDKSPEEIYIAFQDGSYSQLAKTNPVAQYNFERLHYDYKQNYKAI
jgi:hypothetical protein